MYDVGVADILHAHLVRRQIRHIVLMVVGTTMAEGEQGRSFPDGSRTEPGTRSPLGSEVVGSSHDGDVSVDRVPVEAERRLGKG